MSSEAPLVKQMACLRRKPNMTRKEFFDHHFRVHGALSDGTEDVDSKPHKYIQTHFFDAAFGSRAGGPVNANQSWFGRDDVTELYFRDWNHLGSCFGSSLVRTKVGPDGLNFSDFETAIPLIVREKPLSLETELTSEMADKLPSEGERTVAMLFLSTPQNLREGEELEKVLSPALVTALETHASKDVWGLLANIGIVSTVFDVGAYFGGTSMPQYAVVYKVFMKDSGSVAEVRKAQTMFLETAREHIDARESFIAFGKEGLIMDMGNDIRFDVSRQPHLPDLTGPSHLDY